MESTPTVKEMIDYLVEQGMTQKAISDYAGLGNPVIVHHARRGSDVKYRNGKLLEKLYEHVVQCGPPQIGQKSRRRKRKADPA